MKTAGDFRAEAEHLRELAKGVTDAALLQAMHEQIDELEARARELENGSS
jgi:hypothetical protein